MATGRSPLAEAIGLSRMRASPAAARRESAEDLEAAARIAVIGTALAKWSQVRLRCVGGKGRRVAAVVQVAGR